MPILFTKKSSAASRLRTRSIVCRYLIGNPPEALFRPAFRGRDHTMIAPDIKAAIAALGEMVDRAEVIVPFTGAGISTECGIPDFRSPGGLWSKTKPIDFELFLSSQAMRDEAWRRRFAMEQYFSA